MSYRLIIGGAALAAIIVGTTACKPVRQALHIDTGRPMIVATTLTCPDEQGHLTKVSASADGHSCVYRGGRGEDVTLSLLPLNGETPTTALAPLEDQLRALQPRVAAPPAPEKVAAPSDGDNDHDSDHDSDQDNDHDGDHTKVDLPFVHVDADDRHGHDRAKVDVPFVHVDADDDKAHVKVFGVTIDADDDNANVHTNWGSKTAVIKAGPQGAEIRAADMRHGAADMLYILASDNPGPSGYCGVGYVARGPSSGPLVVATFKTRVQHHRDFHDHDVDALIRLNLKR